MKYYSNRQKKKKKIIIKRSKFYKTNQDYSGSFLTTCQTLHIESGVFNQNTFLAELKSCYFKILPQ